MVTVSLPQQRGGKEPELPHSPFLKAGGSFRSQGSTETLLAEGEHTILPKFTGFHAQPASASKAGEHRTEI